MLLRTQLRAAALIRSANVLPVFTSFRSSGGVCTPHHSSNDWRLEGSLSGDCKTFFLINPFYVLQGFLPRIVQRHTYRRVSSRRSGLA